MITTVIPTFARPRTLPAAVASVLAQTVRDCRAAVYDDGGSPETEDVVRALARHDSRVTYVRNPVRLGAARNFCRGLEEVDSEYFSFLSDDDVLLPEFFERALAAFERHPDADIAGGVTPVVDGAGRVISDPREWIPSGWHAAPSGLETMLRTRHREWTGLLFRRRVRDHVGLIDVRTEVPDLDYLLRAAGVCNLILFDEPVALFTSHPGSSTFDLAPRFVFPSYLYLAERLREDRRIPPAVRQRCARELESRVDTYLWRRALRDAAAGRLREARAVVEIVRSGRGQRAAAFLLDAVMQAAGTVPAQHGLALTIGWKRALRRWLRSHFPPAAPRWAGKEEPDVCLRH